MTTRALITLLCAVAFLGAGCATPPYIDDQEYEQAVQGFEARFDRYEAPNFEGYAPVVTGGYFDYGSGHWSVIEISGFATGANNTDRHNPALIARWVERPVFGPQTVSWTTSAGCSALTDLVERLPSTAVVEVWTSLGPNAADLTRRGIDDGTMARLRLNALFPGDTGRIELIGNVDSAPDVWLSDAFQTLETCWVLTPPQIPTLGE